MAHMEKRQFWERQAEHGACRVRDRTNVVIGVGQSQARPTREREVDGSLNAPVQIFEPGDGPGMGRHRVGGKGGTLRERPPQEGATISRVDQV